MVRRNSRETTRQQQRILDAFENERTVEIIPAKREFTDVKTTKMRVAAYCVGLVPLMNHNLGVLNFRNKPILKRLTTIQIGNLLVSMQTKVLQGQQLSGVNNLNR